MKAIYFLVFIALSSFGIISCQTDYSPKPRGYFRIELPEKSYVKTKATGCPFEFEMPSYARLVQDQEPLAKPCWLNLDFPSFNARIHISYFDISPEATFAQLTEDARSFAFKHTSKATAIDQKYIRSAQSKVYGLQYLIKGNTASNNQFFLTDSTHHYLRAALYFNEKPKIDSIQPVLDFINADITHMINSFHWR